MKEIGKETGLLLSLKRSLWSAFAGTRGGVTRIRIVELLRDRPYNMNQIHEKLNMDYKTIQHHINVLKNENIIVSDDKNKYGSVYFLYSLLEENIYLFEEILEKIGKKNINAKDKSK
jgi:DNA-binding transcriptional ArsR family regulator